MVLVPHHHPSLCANTKGWYHDRNSSSSLRQEGNPSGSKRYIHSLRERKENLAPTFKVMLLDISEVGFLGHDPSTTRIVVQYVQTAEVAENLEETTRPLKSLPKMMTDYLCCTVGGSLIFHQSRIGQHRRQRHSWGVSAISGVFLVVLYSFLA